MIMKRKITWKQLFSSSVIRVMCIVIAVMIPVNVVTILLGKMAVNRAEEQFASETKGALDLYMLQVEDAMKRAAWKTQQIAVDDVDFAKINSKKITTTTEYYDELQSVVRLKEVMNKAIDDNIFAAGMYAFFPEKEIKIVESNYSSYQTELFEQINRIIEEKEIQKVGYWEVVDLETTDIALYVGKHQNAYFGAWFDLNQILRRIVKEDGNPQIQAFISEDRQIYSEKNAENIDLETVLNNPKKAGYIVIRTENKYADENDDNNNFYYGETNYFTEITQDDLLAEYDVQISPMIIAEIYILGIGVVFISILIPSFMIMRFNPKKILMNQN